MKKTSRFILSWLFAFVALITISFGANAQNRIYLEDFTIKDYNPVEVQVMLDNDVPVAGMQFHVKAKGLKVLGIKGTDRLTSGQKIDSSALPFVLIYGSTTFTGNSGAIATIEVQAEPGTFSQENPELSLTIYNVLVSQLGGIEVPMNTSATAVGTLDKDVIPYKVLPAQGYDKIILTEGEETTIVLDLEAVFPPHSNQAFITLPEGVEFVENSVAKGSACAEGAEAFTFYQANNGRWSVLITNTGGFAFNSGMGSLFSFKVIAQNGAPENGQILINSEGTEKINDNLYIPYTSSCVIEFTCEEPVEETSVWVVGNGTGMTWDLPGQKIEGENGIVEFNLTNVSAFKVSTVETTNWDTFNANALATGNTNFSDKVANDGGETLPVEIWGENQDLPWTGNYTITLNLNDKTMTAYTSTPKPVEAPAVYIRGDMNNWLNGGLQDEWKFTNVSWDTDNNTGEYTLKCKINAGVEFKIADANWGSINYGIGTNQPLNEWINLNYSGSNMTLSNDFDGTITFKIVGDKQATVIFATESQVTNVEIVSSDLLWPSYTSNNGNVTSITEGQSVKLTAVLIPEDSTEALNWTATMDGVEIEGITIVSENDSQNLTVEVATDWEILDLESPITVMVTANAQTENVCGTFELIVNPIILGDANNSGSVNVADVVTTANYLVNDDNESTIGNLLIEFDQPNADVITNDWNSPVAVNGITVQDITAIVNIALGRESSNVNSRRQVSSFKSNDRLVAAGVSDNNISVALDGRTAYSALQVEIEMPAGMSVYGVEKGSRAISHELAYGFNADGNMVVVLYSLDNSSFAEGEGALFSLLTEGGEAEDMRLINVLASDSSSNGYVLEGVYTSESTGIFGIDADAAEEAVYYSVEGVRVLNPEKGQILIRIANGKAVKVIF